MIKRTIKARIRCEIEVEVGTWGERGVDLAKLADHVKSKGVTKILAIFRDEHGGSPHGKIIGEPKAVLILFEEE